MSKDFVNWGEVEDYINKVISRPELIRNLYAGKLKGVYGIPRGGSILAVMLSHKMNIPLLMAPCSGCIIIDDIADTGETLLHYSKIENCYITTMFYHKQSKVVPDYWYKEKKENWIVYPWEGNNE